MFRCKLGRKAKLGISFSALLLLVACGGNGSTPAAPPVAVNQPPVVSAASKQTIVTEGQPFELDASGSSDRDGDALSYTWRQVSGPSVTIASPAQPRLTLTAPMLDADETLSFEVTVSDGGLSRSGTVSLSIENLKADEVQSQATQYGTSGPINPSITVADPSVYEGNKPLVAIKGLTSTPGGGYTLHWTHLSGGVDMPISSQEFSASGERVGAQIDGVFLGGPFETSEAEREGFGNLRLGATFDTVVSGENLYYANAVLELSNSFSDISLGLSAYRGAVDGEVDSLGDSYVDQREDYINLLGFANAPIGPDKLLSLIPSLEDGESELVITAYIIDPNGQSLSHVLSRAAVSEAQAHTNAISTSVYDGMSYAALWTEYDSENGYDIKVQRSNQDGNLLGNVETVNTSVLGDQIYPVSAAMTDGNIFTAWLDNSSSEGARIKARIMRPDGTFAAAENTLPPILPSFDPEDEANDFYMALTALNTNQVMVSWRDETSGSSQLRGLVVDSEFKAVSNELLIAEGSAAEYLSRVHTVVLPDNRVVMAWLNQYSVPGEPLTGTSHSASFYPVGKN